jgi:pimeloyl-ACP methyl ester carboxylesterase
MKSQLHFAHANGFPSATYRRMLDGLSPHLDVKTLPLIGHDPGYPVTNNWPHLKRQLIDSIERQCDRPVVGLGHSLGGGLTIMAALERPDLFDSIIILDVPLFSRFESWVVRSVKALGLIDNLTPAGRSKNRRRYWSSPEEASVYFQSRGLFRKFHPDCLQDYLTNATRTVDDGGVELSYEVPVELAIFRTVPHTLWVRPGQLQVPGAVILGRDTDTVRKNQYLRMKHKLNMIGTRMPGGHMFPLEHPDQTAAEVLSMIHRLHQQRAA